VNTSFFVQLNKARNLSYISVESRKHFIYQANVDNFQLTCGTKLMCDIMSKKTHNQSSTDNLPYLRFTENRNHHTKLNNIQHTTVIFTVYLKDKRQQKNIQQNDTQHKGLVCDTQNNLDSA